MPPKVVVRSALTRISFDFLGAWFVSDAREALVSLA
jgi:hypothetical protein